MKNIKKNKNILIILFSVVIMVGFFYTYKVTTEDEIIESGYVLNSTKVSCANNFLEKKINLETLKSKFLKIGNCEEHKKHNYYMGDGNDVYFFDCQFDRFHIIPSRWYVSKIKNADCKTFIILGDGYSKDKKHVYKWADIMENADPVTFRKVGDGYWTDKNYTYNLGNIIEKSDQKKMIILNSFYSKNGNSVYYNGEIIKGSDSKTFRAFGDTRYAKDKINIFYNGSLVENANPKYFKKLMNEYWGDNSYIYYRGDLLDNSDSKTFEKLAFNYSKDKNNAYLMLEEVTPELTYWRNIIIPDIDYETFEVVNKTYSKDKNHVYKYGLIINADPKTFTVKQD